MATHKSAIKRHKQNINRRMRNKAYKTRAKTAIKEVRNAVKEKDIERAQASLKETVSILQKTQTKGVIHVNTSSRKIARLSREVHKLAAVSSEGDKGAEADSPE
ncbi:MAG: 30S ribosomal protein S20 [Thermodesulfobacteriota bacterium]